MPTSADLFISDRLILVSNGAKVFAENPTIGVGLGNYVFELIRIAPLGSGLQYWQYDYPHNAIAELLMELGICGIILLYYIIWKLVPNKYYTFRTYIIFVAIIAPLILLDHYLWTNQIGRIMLILYMSLIPSIFTVQKIKEN